MLYETNQEKWVVSTGKGFAVAEAVKVPSNGVLVHYKNCNTFEALFNDQGNQVTGAEKRELINKLRLPVLPCLPSIIKYLYDVEQIKFLTLSKIQLPSLDVEGVSIPNPVVQYIGENAYGYGYDFWLIRGEKRLRISISSRKGNTVYQKLYSGSLFSGSAGCGGDTPGRWAKRLDDDVRRQMILDFIN